MTITVRSNPSRPKFGSLKAIDTLSVFVVVSWNFYMPILRILLAHVIAYTPTRNLIVDNKTPKSNVALCRSKICGSCRTLGLNRSALIKWILITCIIGWGILHRVMKFRKEFILLGRLIAGIGLHCHCSNEEWSRAEEVRRRPAGSWRGEFMKTSFV